MTVLPSRCRQQLAMKGTLLLAQERKQLLSFVVVGGGPTGIEVAAELHDMAVDDLSKIYPDLIKFVRIRVIELQDHVLSTYDREISNYTAKEFSRCRSAAAGTSARYEPVLRRQALVPACREGIDLVLNSRVASGVKGVRQRGGHEAEQDGRDPLWRMRLGHRRGHAPARQASCRFRRCFSQLEACKAAASSAPVSIRW